MQLVFETDGDAMEGSDGLPVFGEVGVEFFGLLDTIFEENLEETVCLVALESYTVAS